ncbi:hypothetical protein Tco_0679760 [Tanacetum coccineum]|uniref:Uncharacterized protein n=1 Tax=Tanacetum coccineum TaxID=301880 RepID=A0ABQ4XJL2_9ASTR
MPTSCFVIVRSEKIGIRAIGYRESLYFEVKGKAMITPTPKRYRWEIVYPTGPRRWTCPITRERMIRTPYRRQIPIEIPFVQEEMQSPRSILEVEKKEEDPEE